MRSYESSSWEIDTLVKVRDSRHGIRSRSGGQGALKTLILSNRLDPLKRVLKDVSGPLRYLRLAETAEARRVCDYMGARPGSIELPRARLLRQHGKSFKLKYLELMGRMNHRNHSLHWWAMPFTDKHALARTSFRDMSAFLLIVELISGDTTPLIVVTDSHDLADQVRAWGEPNGVRVVTSVRGRRSWQGLLKRYTPAAVLYAALRTTLLWLLSRRHRPARNTQDSHLVITTLTYPRSFTATGGYRDAYFGRLVEEVSASGSKVILLALVLGQPFRQLKLIERLDHDPPIVPLESCLSFKDVVACYWRALAAYARPIRIQGDTRIDGLDMRHLLERAVRTTVRSGAYFMSLRVYYGARQLARTVRVTRCLYPYENRSLEKMLLLAVKGTSPETRMVGYQHASVTPSHINFTLQENEARVTPLPDLVLTTGEMTKVWLERQGNYPPHLFKAACALRQGNSAHHEPKVRGQRLSNLLVALANNVEEYVGTLSLLESAFAAEDGINVRVRPHPTIPLKAALQVAPLARPGFYSESTGTLSEDLDWAHVVLYASSTVGLEAVAMGIPAVYLDLGNFLHTDPMFGWEEFKWSAAEPEELRSAIRRIESIPDDRFRELQRAAQAYAASYLSPVTASSIRAFWEA